MTGRPQPPITNRITSTPTATWIGGAGLTTTTATLSFGNFVAAQSGLMVVCYVGRADNNKVVNSISIGGTNGTIFLPHFHSTGVDNGSWGIRQVGAGTQAVVVTLSTTTGTASRHECGVWLLNGSVSDMPVVYDYSDSASLATIDLDHSAPPKSLTLFFCGAYSAADETVNSFTTSEVDAADAEVGTSGQHYRPARFTNNTNNTINRTETVTCSATLPATLYMATWI